jgi:hypothetical protein
MGNALNRHCDHGGKGVGNDITKWWGVRETACTTHWACIAASTAAADRTLMLPITLQIWANVDKKSTYNESHLYNQTSITYCILVRYCAFGIICYLHDFQIAISLILVA